MCFPMDYCCCCFKLEVGAKIVSILSLILSLFVTVLYALPMQLMVLPPEKMVVYSTMVTAFALQSILGFFHIYGVFAKKPGFVWPWIVLAWMKSVLLMAAAIIGTSIIITNRRFEFSDEINVVISAFIVYSMILFYFTSVSNSYRIEMTRHRKEMEVSKALMRRRMPPNAWKYV